MAFSGTVSTFTYDSRRVLDHAFRRADLIAEAASAENIDIGIETLFTLMSEWVNAGFPLWTRTFSLFGPTIGSPTINMPIGTVDVMHTFWRILQPWRGNAVTTGGANANVLFAGQPNSDVVIAGANPGVTAMFGTPTEVDTVGVLLGNQAAFTAALQLYGSTDGVTFTLVQTLPSATYSPGQWVYFDLNPSLTYMSLKLVYPTAGSWTLNQLNFGLANGTDIEMGVLNIDDYYQLPNKLFQDDRCISVFIDRQVNFPVLTMWPTPNANAFYNGCVSVLSRRHMMDPGTMVNQLEVPQRWYEAIVWRLASMLIDEIPQKAAADQQGNYFTLMAKQQRIQRIETKAQKAESLAWSEERARGPIRLNPNVACYTR